jgi:DNA-binding PadR family transcriptional regulator
MLYQFRMSRATVRVLDALLAQPTSWRYGYDVNRETGLKSGTLYPILIRLADRSLLETRWEEAEPGRPPRHMYRLTSRGLREARRVLEEAGARGFVVRPLAQGSES